MSATFNLSKNNEWETPPDLFQMGCDYFDFEPSMDLCATGFNKKCKNFIKNKIKFGDCIKEDRVSNRNNKEKGKWVFKSIPGKTKKTPVSKKTVDKTSENVVSSSRAKRTKTSSKPKDE